jgi:hypothetical protein
MIAKSPAGMNIFTISTCRISFADPSAEGF